MLTASIARLAVALLTLASLACTKADAPPATPSAATARATSPVAVDAGALAPVSPVARADVGPHYVEDDVDAAMKSAKDAGKVVFVDGWAQWCHTCLSMQRDVLRDKALAAYEDRVVFAAVDTDKPEAAPFVAKFPLRAWPTFFVIDPATQSALAEHGGSLSLPELTSFIDDALRSRDPKMASEPQVKELLLGHVSMGKKDYAAAAKHYAAAASLDDSAAHKARIPQAALGAMRAFSGAKDTAGCVDFGMRELKAFRTSSSSADFMGYIVGCASELKDGDARKKSALAAVRTELEAMTQSPPAGASVDDKADALAILADVAEAQKDDASFKAAHEKRIKLLEDDANAQKNVDDARVHDYARMNSYLALKRGDDAIKLFTERTKQLPESYEAWARLASAYHQLARDDDALPAANKAIALSYGPRRLRYRTLVADIYAAKKDSADEKRAVQELIDDASALPPGQRDDETLAKATKRLAALKAAK